MEAKKYVTYEDFGAVGDGVTDDMPAIVKAHEYANNHLLTVKVSPKTYYIGPADRTAKIMTDVDFGEAKFIIDDVQVQNRESSVFLVCSEHTMESLPIERLDRGQKRLEVPHEGTMYVRVYDDEQKVYIRKGANQNNGTAKNDAFILDPDGNILSELPWQFDRVSRVRAKRIDDRPLTIRGGTFTTIANEGSIRGYYDRGFTVTRSYVTIENVTHLVQDDPKEFGSPYTGFFIFEDAAYITLKNCLLTPHLTYRFLMANGKPNAYGSYDIRSEGVIGLSLIGVRQSISIEDTRYWGLMATNFSKDLLIEDCIVSRFDAHQGVINVTMRSSAFGHQRLQLTGFGKCVVENCSAMGMQFFLMRYDYGSFFEGDILVKNCTWTPGKPSRSTPFDAYFMYSLNDGTHDFGYPCRLARSITVDGLTIDDEGVENLYLFNKYDSDLPHEHPYPLALPDTVVFRGVSTKSGRKPIFFEAPEQYTGMTVRYE